VIWEKASAIAAAQEQRHSALKEKMNAAKTQRETAEQCLGDMSTGGKTLAKKPAGK